MRVTALDFDFTGSPARIVFARGGRARTPDILADLGASRALVLATEAQKDSADAFACSLGKACLGVYAGAVMHTPVAATEAALEIVREQKVDCVIAFGGGSTIGLAKAIAWRTDLPQIAVPTTYAGSEVTNILGQTEKGVKTTLKSPRVIPEVVVYDPDLTSTLPVGMSVTSGINAMAHAVEALYARDRNPISDMIAGEGLRALAEALPPHRRDTGRSRCARACLLRVVALRDGAGAGGHGDASQALPHAGRALRSAACRDAHRDPAACHRLQRRRRRT
jgi:maleylacetate reductase